MSYVIVKSPSKPYIVVHSHTALLHENESTIIMAIALCQCDYSEVKYSLQYYCNTVIVVLYNPMCMH